MTQILTDLEFFEAYHFEIQRRQFVMQLQIRCICCCFARLGPRMSYLQRLELDVFDRTYGSIVRAAVYSDVGQLSRISARSSYARKRTKWKRQALQRQRALLARTSLESNDNHVSKCRYNVYIRCTTLLPPFFFRNSRLYCKNWLYIYDSKYCPSLATTFSHLSAYESRVEKTGHLLRLSTNRSNFLLLHKTGSAG